MTDSEKDSRPAGPSRMRVICARVLTVVAILLALVGMLAFYVENTALDEDGFGTISRNMIENDEIQPKSRPTGRHAVRERRRRGRDRRATASRSAGTRSDSGRSRPLGCRSGGGCGARAATGAGVWVAGTTATQRQLVRLLDDDTRFIQTEGGAVVLDLRPIVIELGDQVAVIGRVAERLPESSGKITIIEEEPQAAQTITKFLRAVADWMARRPRRRGPRSLAPRGRRRL